MKQTERGFALLTSHLGDPERKCLTVAQFRVLAQRVQNAQVSQDVRDLEARDLVLLGYSADFAQRIVDLLEEEWRLDAYLSRANLAGCHILTRISEQYPHALRVRLGLDAPGCLWYKGDLSILELPKVSLVGSREIAAENQVFAELAGYQAAKQGCVLVSGNARGADKTAQNACLEAGGKVISILSDDLSQHAQKENLLYLSEDAFDAPFTPQRALSRNRLIHSLSSLTLVAQCSLKSGGTWDGTARNLRGQWSKVCCFDDGSAAMDLLAQMGAEKIGLPQLQDLAALAMPQPTLFE